jgi:membrane protein
LRWLWQLAKDVVDEYKHDRVGDLAASITFWTILSIPAAVLALVSALSSLESRTLPSSIRQLGTTILH